MKHMIPQLSKQEWSLLQEAISDEVLFHGAEEQLSSLSEHYDADYLGRFNGELFAEFMGSEVQKRLQQVDFSDFEEKLSAAEMGPEDLATYAGSQGVTGLIKKFLEKMKSAEVNDTVIKNLVELVQCRNQLFAIERDYINQHYKAWLKRQIS